MKKDGLTGLRQQKDTYPEIAQFFEMLVLPSAWMGYDKERVIDSLLCLDGLYRSKIAEIKGEFERRLAYKQNRLEQQEQRIEELERDGARKDGVGRGPAHTRRQAREILAAAAGVRETLDGIFEKAAREADAICENVRKRAQEIARKNREEMEEERLRHRNELAKMEDLKRQYTSDLSVLKGILTEMQDSATAFQRKLETVGAVGGHGKE